jgi:4-amino-4-deoxy-L-arabinose transferase-like glycosyltransferase
VTSAPDEGPIAGPGLAAAERPPRDGSDAGIERASWVWLSAATLFHLLLAIRFPLAPDETYYWEWSRHLALGYYDQGPMVAWWIAASRLLFGDTPLGVRFGIVVAATATLLFVYLLARDLFNPRIAFVSLLVSTITPLAIVGSFIATYDPLVILFWAAAAYFAAKALFLDSRGAWIGLGVAFGLGLLAKHTMVLFAVALLLFLALSPKHRKWLARPQPYLALGIAIVVFSPNLWWQSQNEWVTFRHLFLLTGKGLDQPLLRRLGDFLGSQAGLISPLLFIGLVAAMIWAMRRAREEEFTREWYLCALSAPILALFVVMTVKSKVQANWAVCGWITAPILWAVWLDRVSTGRHGEERGWAGVRRLLAGRFTQAALALSLFLAVMIAWPESRAVLPFRIPPKWDTQMNKLFGGQELGTAVDRVKKEMEAEGAGPVTIGAVTYDVTSRLAFYTPGRPHPFCFFLGTRLNSYALWQEPYRPRIGGSALIADDRPPGDPDRVNYSAIFDRVEPVPEPVATTRREPYYLYKCYGYRRNPAAETTRGG